MMIHMIYHFWRGIKTWSIVPYVPNKAYPNHLLVSPKTLYLSVGIVIYYRDITTYYLYPAKFAKSCLLGYNGYMDKQLEDIKAQASVLQAMSMYLAIVDTDETVANSAKKLALNLSKFVEATSNPQINNL